MRLFEFWDRGCFRSEEDGEVYVRFMEFFRKDREIELGFRGWVGFRLVEKRRRVVI